MVVQSVRIQWPCRYDYFFTPASVVCPAAEAIYPTAAEQPFEHGRMIWLKETRVGEFVDENVIFVLYENGQLEKYQDKWMPNEPDSDPTFVPPEGLYQPIRGFGKLWRENKSVRERLGWARTPEQGFEGAWQPAAVESLGGTTYIRALDGEIIVLTGLGAGGSFRWSPLP